MTTRPSDEPIPGWFTNPRLAFAEGGRVGFADGYAAGLAEALEVAALLYGPWRFDADAVWRGVEERDRRDRERAERTARGS